MDSNKTTSNVTLEEMSLTQLSNGKVQNLIVVVVSTIGVVTNTLVLVTIAKTKELHNKSQYIIFTHSFAEAFYSLIMAMFNLKKFLHAALGIPDVISRANCLFIIIPVVVVSKTALFAILVLGVDRLLAVGLPIFYKNLKPSKYITLVNVIIWGFNMAHVPFMFIDNDIGVKVHVCLYGLVLTTTYRTVDSLESNISIGMTIAVYGTAIGVVSVRYWGTKWQSEAQRSNWAKQIQMGAFRMMMLVGVIFIICWGVANGINYVLTFYASVSLGVALGPYIALLNIINSGSHFFVYFSLSERFRTSCLKILHIRKVNSVGTTAGVTAVG